MNKFSIFKIIFFLFISIITILYFLNNYYNLNSTILNDGFMIFTSIIAFTIGYIIDVLSERINDAKEVKDYYNDIRGSIRNSITLIQDDKLSKEQSTKDKSESKDTSDIIELMLLNMKEIKEYYVMSKNMARSSFALSVIMCVFGFVVISSSIVAMFFY